MSELARIIPELFKKFTRHKDVPQVSPEDETVLVEPEHRNLRASICLLTISTLEAEKFVMVTLPEEDFNGPFTKAERGIVADGLLFVNREMLAFPSGALDGDESSAAATIREMLEENDLALDANKLEALPIPQIETYQSTVGNAGTFPSQDNGPLNTGSGFLRVRKIDLEKRNFRYGYYTFVSASFKYQLNEAELEVLQANMNAQGRQVRLLTIAEALALDPFRIRPSSKQLLLEYLKTVKKVPPIS